MIIEKLDIKNYGKLKDRRIALRPGINVIYGENESGKSTLHSFIRSMFFGTKRLRGKGAKTDTYNRYQPWENPAHYAGSMEFSCGDQLFSLTRNFYKELDEARLVNMLDGEELSMEDGDLLMLLGGVNEGIFDNTVSVGQLRSVTGRELSEELSNYLANYQGGADEDINPTEAVGILKEKKKALLQEKRQEQERRQQQIQQIQTKQEILHTEQEACSRKQAECEEQITRGKALQQETPTKGKTSEKLHDTALEKKRREAARQAGNRLKRLWNGIAITWAVILLITLLLAVVFKGKEASTIFLVMACAAAIQIPISFAIRWWVGRKLALQRNAQEEADLGREDVSDVETPKENPAEDQIKTEEGRLHQLREEMQERSVLLENLAQEMEELQETQYDSTETDEELEAVELAMDTLTRTVSQMQNSVGSRLRIRMGEILSELTDGKYTSVLMDSGMDIRVQTISRSIELYQLSRGTLEQVYFALRMAASEVLCAQEPMPVILDDVFAMYDEARLKKALKWLMIHKKQVIILTCHRREGDLLKEIGGYYEVKLREN